MSNADVDTRAGSIGAPRNIGELGQGRETEQDVVNVETTAIGKYTLHFSSEVLEQEWRGCNIERQQGLVNRFFFVAGVFQILFFCSDVVEGTDFIFTTTPLRFISALLVFTASLLGQNGIIKPDMSSMFTINMTYAACTLTIFCLQRHSLTQWDVLFPVYGLSFFILPKLQPLDFFYGCLGSSLFSLSYISISLYRLALPQWMLSSVYLLIPLVMFNYVSYASEKTARERWLLKQRLSKERIQVKLNPVDDRGSSLVLSMNLSGKQQAIKEGNPPQPAQRQRKRQLVKGWFSTNNIPEVLRLVDSSVAWAVFTHSVGFSFFLVLVTGQLRWILVVAAVSAFLLLLFSVFTLPSSFLLLAIHGIGYVLFAVMLALMLGVFGGVVYLWSELIDFVKRICTQYPQIQESLKESPILEQVLVPQLGRVVDSKSLKSSLEPEAESIRHAGRQRGKEDFTVKRKATTAAPARLKKKGNERTKPKCPRLDQGGSSLVPVSAAIQKDSEEPEGLPPPSAALSHLDNQSIVKERERLRVEVEEKEKLLDSLSVNNVRVTEDQQKLKGSIEDLQAKMNQLEAHRLQREREWEGRLRQAAQHHEQELNQTLQTLNAEAHRLHEREKELHQVMVAMKSKEDENAGLRHSLELLQLDLEEARACLADASVTESRSQSDDSKVDPAEQYPKRQELDGTDVSAWVAAPRRLRYAKLLELEGLRESARGSSASSDDV